ncbi:kinesin-like protein KIFC3 isoform X3 [Mastacembelus armatus]|uniref:kinesin-like protein KIFC3 isoform X2 n=1 Tax=Mastacembelus armatus TaxID=205130 RepID=UPI000E455761|nr:kinesin-like protein KIFC3 isoform X2 [Mastacembelus armatus]XP_026149196.1 kinesin-like protein KIFC3 isoform X3 [Mastacembelus armatus]
MASCATPCSNIVLSTTALYFSYQLFKDHRAPSVGLFVLGLSAALCFFHLSSSYLISLQRDAEWAGQVLAPVLVSFDFLWLSQDHNTAQILLCGSCLLLGLCDWLSADTLVVLTRCLGLSSLSCCLMVCLFAGNPLGALGGVALNLPLLVTTQEPGPVSMETESQKRDGHTPKMERKACAHSNDSSSSSDSDEMSLSDEDEDDPDIPACTPLGAFLSFKQDTEKRRASQVQLETTGKLAESPLVAVMSHLLSFLEQYSHFQQLQQQADQYRVQLKRHRVQHRRQMKALRASYRQRLRDKNSIISNLEEAVSQEQTPSPLSKGESSSDTVTKAGVHRLVESLYSLQGERTKLRGELHLLHSQLEQKERDRHSRIQAFQQQIDELKSCIEEREEELSRLRTATGATDSEKRVLCLSAENESLKQSLSITQGLLQQLSAIPSQSSTMLVQENENLRSRVQQLEISLQQRAVQLSQLERQSEQSEWRRREELSKREDRVRELQLELDRERGKEPVVKYVTQTVEVESPFTLKQLTKVRQRNELLSDKLSNQTERCKQLEEQIRKSDEYSCNLQHKIAAYEQEISKLKEELLKEIGHLEERKEEAVMAAANCSAEHFLNLQDQFFTLQKRLTALPSTLRSMKTDYASLKSQVQNFSEFYGAAINEAKKQISAAISEMSEANKDLLEKYRKEVALRRKYHEQLVELKGNIRVLCRVKPVLKEDQQEEGQSVVVTTDPNNESSLAVLNKGKTRVFELDKVFHPQATQEEVFQEIEPLVTSCIDGYHVCIFAYGQTGSGKTYTMEGNMENPGINQRALKQLFSVIEERKDMWSYTITVSSVEIYNEVLRDLMSKDGEKLDIKINPDGTGQLHVPGLRVIEVKSFQHIKKILATARRNRITFGTQMNQHSSRSHALLCVTVQGTDLATGSKTTGKLNLVDLAGSERVWKSGAEGERLKEAQNINRSLLALGDVIQALRARHTHIPFRNSRLTYLLQDSLGKGSKTVMVVQVSALESNLGETLCSLKFAQRVCKVELGPAARKIESGGVQCD